jgi:hypothetical protein
MTLAARSDETAPVTPPYGDSPGNWTREAALALYEAPFNDLLFQAQTVHRRYFDPNKVRSAGFSASRPAVVPRIAAIAASRAIMNPASRPSG